MQHVEKNRKGPNQKESFIHGVANSVKQKFELQMSPNLF
jgi:hypothetical protein